MYVQINACTKKVAPSTRQRKRTQMFRILYVQITSYNYQPVPLTLPPLGLLEDAVNISDILLQATGKSHDRPTAAAHQQTYADFDIHRPHAARASPRVGDRVGTSKLFPVRWMQAGSMLQKTNVTCLPHLEQTVPGVLNRRGELDFQSRDS